SSTGISRRSVQRSLAGRREQETHHTATQRLTWGWILEDWQHVVWSDESQCQLFGADGGVHVWCRPHEAMDPNTGRWVSLLGDRWQSFRDFMSRQDAAARRRCGPDLVRGAVESSDEWSVVTVGGACWGHPGFVGSAQTPSSQVQSRTTLTITQGTVCPSHGQLPFRWGLPERRVLTETNTHRDEYSKRRVLTETNTHRDEYSQRRVLTETNTHRDEYSQRRLTACTPCCHSNLATACPEVLKGSSRSNCCQKHTG
ncbi:hypothetical protein NFI96_026327, partial [Prochilodus magdalenae]